MLRDREDPPASRGRNLDGGGDPRSSWNDGDWARAWEDDDRQARKSTRWDRRSQSFDDRGKKYHDAGRDVDRGARRTRDYDEPRRPPMSRSYSHNDRRPSGSADGGRVDPRSRSRSRSRARIRRDLDHTKVTDSGIIPADAADDGDCDVHYGHVDEMPRQQRRVPSSVVVADSADQAMATEDGEAEFDIHGLNRTRDVSEDEDGEFAAARLNGEDDVHPLKSVKEPALHRGSQLSNAVEDREAANAPTMVMDACTRETSGEDNAYSEATNEMVAPHPHSEGKPELPASCRPFDLNVVETPDACEMAGDPQADHVSDLVGWIHQQTNCHASEFQGQDERHMLKNGHDLIRYDLNSEAVEDAQDIHLLEDEKLPVGLGIDAHDTTRIQCWRGSHLRLNQNAGELEHENDCVIGEQLLLSDGMDGHLVRDYQMASEPKMGVYDLHSYNLESEKMLLDDGAEKHAHDNCHLHDGQVLFNQSANLQAHNRANERTIPVINLEDDDYEEQSDIREFLESKSYQCLGHALL